MAGDAVVSITTGSLHCAAVTQFGHVYVWGCNRHGALGVHHMHDVWVPEAIPMHALMAKVNQRSREREHRRLSRHHSRHRSRHGSSSSSSSSSFSSSSSSSSSSSFLVADGSLIYPMQVACGERCTIVLLDKQASG
jgi:alpha-tubulin suppressor-like RCC1 family protein